jgi:hypothetical protein
MPEIVLDNIHLNYFNVAMPRKGIARMEVVVICHSKCWGDEASQEEWKNEGRDCVGVGVTRKFYLQFIAIK